MIRKVHHLKTWHKFYGAVENGDKSFEVRHNDRDFNKGDFLILWETKGDKYTGKYCVREVTYILDEFDAGLKDNYVVMGIMDPEGWYSRFELATNMQDIHYVECWNETKMAILYSDAVKEDNFCVEAQVVIDDVGEEEAGFMIDKGVAKRAIEFMLPTMLSVVAVE